MLSPMSLLNSRRSIPIAIAVSLFILVTVYMSSSSEFPTNNKIDSFSSNAHSDDRISAPAEAIAFTKEVYEDTTDAYTKITYSNKKTPIQKIQEQDTVLILSSIVDETGYGEDRSFNDFLKTIFSFDYPKKLVSLAFLVGLETEFGRLDSFIKKYFEKLADLPADEYDKIEDFVSKVTLINAPFIEKEFEIDRGMRHAYDIQRKRRRQIARSRNFLLLNALGDERYTIFLDSDIVEIQTPEMLNVFVASGKDIIVPRVTKDYDQDYDRNSWRGERAVPNEQQMKLLDENDWEKQDWFPHDIDNKMYHIHHSLGLEDPEAKKATFNVPLDSVGGAVLFAKSIVYRQGVIFPTYYVIGTTWQRFEGYDGIETEGVCYMARSLGYKCWAYVNQVAVHNKAS